MADPVVWAVIPARGGSKGIEAKNLQKIQGLPLVARSVAAARGARPVSRVFVSTDDEAIAAAARQAGAEIIHRPAAIAGDSATSEAALLHVLEAREKAGDALPDIIVFLQCTSPFTAPADIEGILEALRREDADSALTVVPAHLFLWRRDPEGRAEGINHAMSGRPRRQDLPPEFVETGAVYALRVAGFRAAGHRFFGRTALFETAKLRAMDIDDYADLHHARLLAPLLDRGLRESAIPEPLGGVVFDFDGVMTDDLVTQDENGVEAVTVSRADGMGIALLRDRGVAMAVISRERNPVVARRCEKLGLPFRQACNDKETALRDLARSWGVAPAQLVYVGNDVTDLRCMALAGLGVAVGDAQPEVRAAADLTLYQPGGRGAVRELCDLVLAALVRRGGT